MPPKRKALPESSTSRKKSTPNKAVKSPRGRSPKATNRSLLEDLKAVSGPGDANAKSVPSPVIPSTAPIRSTPPSALGRKLVSNQQSSAAVRSSTNLTHSEAVPKISISSSSKTDRRTSRMRGDRGNNEEDQPILNQFSGWAHGIRQDISRAIPKSLPHYYKLLLLLLLGEITSQPFPLSWQASGTDPTPLPGVVLLAYSGSLAAHRVPAAKVEKSAKTGLLGIFKRLNATLFLNLKRLDATSFFTFKKLNATSLFNIKKLNATSLFMGWKRLGAKVKKTKRSKKKALARARSEKRDLFVERKSMVWA